MTLEKRLKFAFTNPFGVVAWALMGAVLVGMVVQRAVS